MKTLRLHLALAALTLVGAPWHTQAALKVGAVFLDANTNRLIDAGDTPVPGLVIVVTNFLGTFSNATTTAADGSFSFSLPDTPQQSFEDFILSSSLPLGITEILPPFSVFTVSPDVTTFTNFFLLENVLHPPLKVGHVFCDANTNRMIDAGDVPVAGVLVAVTNFSGSFSNTAFTDAQGFFAVQLPGGGLYGDFIVGSSLPAGSTVVIPQPLSVFQFSIPAPPSDIVTNDFLLQNPDCVTVGPMTNRCWLTGGGTFRTSGRKPAFSFSGVVNPRCKATARGGNWNVVDFNNRLRFKSTSLQVVQCGTLPGLPPGSPSPQTSLNFIDFQGVGTLKGIGRNPLRSSPVVFTARAVDLGKPGKGRDQLYLRVDDAAGNTVLLISATPASPLEVQPLPISTGNLQIRVSGCKQ